MKSKLTTLCGMLCLAALLCVQQSASAGTPVTVGGVTFSLTDGYSIKGRTQLNSGESVMICPDTNPNNDRLIMNIYPDVLAGINGLTSEEVSDMLTDAVNKLAGVIAREDSGFKLDKAYRVLFKDDPDCPTAYSSLSGLDKNGKPFQLSSEAMLIHGNIISGCAIGSSQKALDKLVGIFRNAIADQDAVTVVEAGTYPVSVDGITFEVYDHFSLIKREPLDPGASLVFVPDDSDAYQLYLIVMPDIIPTSANVADTRVTEMLKNATKKLADAVVGTFRLKENYELEYDNAGLTPLAYANLEGKTPEGFPFMCHAESTLANGTVISVCAVAADDKMLSEMVGIYEGSVGAALRK